MTPRAWAYTAGAAVLLLAAAYCGGERHGRNDAELKALEDSSRWVAAAIKTNAKAVDTTTKAAALAVKADSELRPRVVAARGRVKLVDSSHVEIVSPTFPGSKDSTTSAPVEVPAPVVQTIEKTDTLVTVDSTAITKLELTVVTITHDDSLRMEHERILQKLVESAKPPTCGVKCGFTLGGLGGYALSNPGQVEKLAKWVVAAVQRIH